MFTITEHAQIRQQNRGVADEHISMVLRYGTEINAAGAIFYFMGNNSIPDNIPSSLKERLAGITIVCHRETGDVLTVYKNKEGLKLLRKKVKYNNPRMRWN